MDNLSRIVVPAHLSSLQKSIDFVSSFSHKAGFDLKRIREVELCVEEVLVNIFHYAYPGAPGEVAVSCRIDPGKSLLIEIEDAGIPFNILSASDPDIKANIDERQIGGLGIFFVRQLMDGVEYRRVDNKNFLFLLAKLPAQPENRNCL